MKDVQGCIIAQIIITTKNKRDYSPWTIVAAVFNASSVLKVLEEVRLLL